ncbi:hypothetical protein PHJA_000949000 [Phtheirospermum japonicum]|uniref:Uncharacterized protein n=1 Tax=Phtheirospermum japonicum TaxID=374723 RepID=A0A830BVX8_9LAMI|nr:hypothetical protein PHJA_000949000 [Phtheirospermum japonicum]
MSTGCMVGPSHCLCSPTYSSCWALDELLENLKMNRKKHSSLLQKLKRRKSQQSRR